jgi:hypothetical protein
MALWRRDRIRAPAVALSNSNEKLGQFLFADNNARGQSENGVVAGAVKTLIILTFSWDVGTF